MEEEGKRAVFFPETMTNKTNASEKTNKTKKGLCPVQPSELFFFFLFRSAAKPKLPILKLFCSKLLLRAQFHCWPPFYNLAVFLPIIGVGFHTFSPLQTGQGDGLPHWNSCLGLAIPYSKLLVMSTSHWQCVESISAVCNRDGGPFLSPARHCSPGPLLPCQHRQWHWNSFPWQLATRNISPCFLSQQRYNNKQHPNLP